jgi:hypothetical protein
MNFECNTIIFYTKIDDSIDSKLLFYKDDYGDSDDDEKEFSYEINVKDKSMVLIDGQVKHKPSLVRGIGIRECVVVQLKSYDDYGKTRKKLTFPVKKLTFHDKK